MTTDDSDARHWRIEEACANAWPAAASVRHEGWLINLSGGVIRRANSVNPLRGRRAGTAVIEAAEAIYRAAGRAAIFRVPSIADDLDQALAERGYAIQAPTLTLTLGGHLAGNDADADPAVSLSPRPTREWIDAWMRFSAADAENRAVYEAMTRAILVPARFAFIEQEGRIVAQAYGTLHRGVLILESVATDAEFRKRGLARRVLETLKVWGREAGAETAALQCRADNDPALALYHGIGLERTLYPYHYRVQPSD